MSNGKGSKRRKEAREGAWDDGWGRIEWSSKRGKHGKGKARARRERRLQKEQGGGMI